MNGFRLLVAILSLAAGYGIYRLGPAALQPTDLRSVVGVLVGASATLLGFLVSAGALLYAVANTSLARNLQRTGHFNNLLADLFVCACAFLVSLTSNMVCLFLPSIAIKLPAGVLPLNWMEWGAVLAGTTTVAALLLLVPVGRKMWLLLSSLQPENPNRLE